MRDGNLSAYRLAARALRYPLHLGVTEAGWGLAGIVKSAISAIYTAVLYRYAADGQAPEGFDAQQLELAFGRK